MDKDIANAALQFLARVDLKGAETPAFMAVISALQNILNANVVPMAVETLGKAPIDPAIAKTDAESKA